MGLFFIGMIFVSLVAMSAVLGIIAIFGHRRSVERLLFLMWGVFFALTTLYIGYAFWAADIEVDKEAIYGEYVIDRSKFPGKQADWQYDHYRFELTKDGKILFHVTDKDRIIKTDTGRISFVENYDHPHLKITMMQPAHHVIDSIPELHVGSSSFYYVFRSKRYGNMFFTKDKWEPREE